MKDTNAMVAALLANAQAIAKLEREFPGILENCCPSAHEDCLRLDYYGWNDTREQRLEIAKKLRNRIQFTRKYEYGKIQWEGRDRNDPRIKITMADMEDMPVIPQDKSVVDLHPDTEDPDDSSGFGKQPAIDMVALKAFAGNMETL